VAEWFKAAVLKTAEVQASVSSNLTPSASEIRKHSRLGMYKNVPFDLERVQEAARQVKSAIAWIENNDAASVNAQYVLPYMQGFVSQMVEKTLAGQITHPCENSPLGNISKATDGADMAYPELSKALMEFTSALKAVKYVGS
jgi:hypothetical protein